MKISKSFCKDRYNLNKMLPLHPVPPFGAGT